MKRVLFLILTLVYYVMIQWHQDDYLYSRLVHERLKNSINRGAHDASLQIKDEEWGEGRIEFDRDKALKAFKTTLADNISLDANTLSPKQNTILKNKVEILFEDYIDAKSQVSYPYAYVNNEYKIRKTIYGPAVIYVVRVPNPVVHPTSMKEDIQKWVVFEYPYPDS